MKNKLLFLSVIVLSFLFIIAIYWFYSVKGKSEIKSNPLEIAATEKHEVTLSTDIGGKRLIFTDKQTFERYLSCIKFWEGNKMQIDTKNGIYDYGRSTKVDKLDIFLTDNGTGNVDVILMDNSGEPTTSVDYVNNLDGTLKLTLYINRNTLMENDSTIDNVITGGLMRAIYIVNLNAPLSTNNIDELGNLANKYLDNQTQTFVRLENSLDLINIKLVKNVKAACTGGIVHCGVVQSWRTCGGSRSGIPCIGYDQCSDCSYGSECIEEDALACSSLSSDAPISCDAGYLCNPFGGCIYSGSCYPATSTPPPSGGGNDCNWSCYAPGNESVSCTGESGVCSPACTGSQLCCRPISCGGGSSTPPTCVISLIPNTITISSPGSTTFIANVYPSNGTVSSVNFSSSSTSIAYVSPSSDTVSPYSTTVLSNRGTGTATITAQAVMSGAVRCTATATVTVSDANAWWQVVDADVVTNGNLNSSVPTSLYFSMVGSGGFPGLSIYGGTTNLTPTKTSTKKWLANSGINTNRSFNSTYFLNAIPSDATINQITSTSEPVSYFASGGVSYNGYYYYEYDAGTTGIDFSVTPGASSNIGDRKVILIVKGANLNITGPINLTKGRGMFLAVTTGNINISSTIGGGATPSLEGIYVADGTINTGVASTKLYVRGSMVGYGGVNLQRDLGARENTSSFSLISQFQKLPY